MPRDAGEGEPDGDEPHKGDDARDAMQAFIEAVHAKDVEGALQAYGALHDIHAAGEGMEDEDKGEG